MKINFDAFECPIGSCVHVVAVVGTENLESFLDFTGIKATDFNPDFVNLNFNLFLFLVPGKNWCKLANSALTASDTNLEFEDVGTPDGFDIDDYYHCSPAVINYILQKDERNYIFLKQTQQLFNATRFADSKY